MTENQDIDDNARDFEVPFLPVVCLDETQEQNALYPESAEMEKIGGMRQKAAFLVVGEPQMEPDEYSSDGGVRHYILLDLRTGKILPGMWHGDRFRRVTTPSSK